MEYGEQITDKHIFTVLLLELLYWSSAKSTDDQWLFCCIITLFYGAPVDADINHQLQKAPQEHRSTVENLLYKLWKHAL